MKQPLLAALILTVFSSALTAEKAIFAGGCFWCIESDFQPLKGVSAAVSGYIGGHVKNPSYKQVTQGNTGHYEAVEITYDPAVISYQQLLQHFWVNIDPFDASGQFCDKGSSYRSAIFTLNSEQRQLAMDSKKDIEQKLSSTQAVATQIIDAGTFYPAEHYHQDYYLNNPKRYKFYRWNCGRDQRLKAIWGDL